jgi:hypothetical protein
MLYRNFGVNLLTLFVSLTFLCNENIVYNNEMAKLTKEWVNLLKKFYKTGSYLLILKWSIFHHSLKLDIYG